MHSIDLRKWIAAATNNNGDPITSFICNAPLWGFQGKCINPLPDKAAQINYTGSQFYCWCYSIQHQPTVIDRDLKIPQIQDNWGMPQQVVFVNAVLLFMLPSSIWTCICWGETETKKKKKTRSVIVCLKLTAWLTEETRKGSLKNSFS